MKRRVVIGATRSLGLALHMTCRDALRHAIPCSLCRSRMYSCSMHGKLIVDGPYRPLLPYRPKSRYPHPCVHSSDSVKSHMQRWASIGYVVHCMSLGWQIRGLISRPVLRKSSR